MGEEEVGREESERGIGSVREQLRRVRTPQVTVQEETARNGTARPQSTGTDWGRREDSKRGVGVYTVKQKDRSVGGSTR